ncbi:HlyD family type I secretion periplasmic adaptor subunit [Candidatus Darwinibacter acetoxidans]
MNNPKLASDNPRYYAMIGYGIIIFCFGVLGIWAAVAPLGGAVVSTGLVTNQGNTKAIQHLEGGIVKNILVHEGDHVEAGQVLLRLDGTAPRANVEILRNQLDAGVARDSRLTAELNGSADIEFPDELTASPDAVALKAMEDQRVQFNERRASLENQISILKSRADQLRQEIDGLNRQQTANEEQVKFISDELKDVKALYEKNLVSKSRWLALERERARLTGEIGRAIAERAKAEKSIGETELQIQQIRQKFVEDATRELVDTREKLRDLRNKFVVAQDTLRRLEIFAPVTGRVQNLKVYTIGAVARQGDTLLEIAPDQDKLVIQAQISTLDIEAIQPGNVAEVRFPAFHDRTLPMIAGTVKSISQDRLVNETNKQPYYLAIIDVPDKNIPEHYRGKLTPGMNAEILMPTVERTALEYLIEPLRNRLRTAFRER